MVGHQGQLQQKRVAVVHAREVPIPLSIFPYDLRYCQVFPTPQWVSPISLMTNMLFPIHLPVQNFTLELILDFCSYPSLTYPQILQRLRHKL